MSSGLTHIGAIARGLAYVPEGDAARWWIKPPGLRGVPHRTAAPVESGAAGAVDPLTLFKMSSQDRIRAETAMIVDAAKRSLAAANQARAHVQPTANFVDLRV